MKYFGALTALLFALCGHSSEIHDLIKSGRVDDAIALVQSNPRLLDAKDDYDCTPLHLASRFGTTDLVAFLIAHGADMNSRSYNQFTPLHVCRSPISAKLLLEAGADLKLMDVWGDTALQMLAHDQQEEVCSALLKAGAKLDLVSALYLKRREEARQIAVDDPHTQTQHVGGLGLFGNSTPLGLAVANGDLELVKLFVSLGAPVNGATRQVHVGDLPSTPLCNAIGMENLEIAKFLLESGAKVEGTAGKFYPDIIDYVVDHSSDEMKELLARYSSDIRLHQDKSKDAPASVEAPGA